MKSFGCSRTAIIAAFLVCFAAIPLNAQTGVFSTILAESGSYLGIQMDEVTADNMAGFKLNSERGVIVRSVEKDSPAEAAKLQADDVILEFAGTTVWSAAQMSRLVKETPPGRKVELAVSRDGKRISVTAEIKERRSRELIGRSPTIPNLRDFERILPRDGSGLFQFRTPDLQDNPKPKLGVTLQPLTDQQAEYFGVAGGRGVLVASVLPNSPSSGILQANDVIVSADGKSVDSPEDLVRIVQTKSGGDIQLKVIRNKRELSVVVGLPEAQKENKGYKL